ERRQGGATHDRPGVDRAAAAGALPTVVPGEALGARRAGIVAEGLALRAALEAQLAAAGRLVERLRVERGKRERQVTRQHLVAPVGGGHRRRMTAPVGSVLPPATKARAQSSTCAVEVPRIWRTA